MHCGAPNERPDVAADRPRLHPEGGEPASLPVLLGRSFIFAGPVVAAQAIVLQRLAVDGRDVLLLAWFGLVAVLYLLPRFPWTSLRQGPAVPCDRSSRIRTAGWRSNAASSAAATR